VLHLPVDSVRALVGAGFLHPTAELDDGPRFALGDLKAFLARMLLRLAASAGIGAEDAADAGREQGIDDASSFDDGTDCLEALMAELDRLGFDPEVAIAVGEAGGEAATVAFTHCPFRELAEAHPDLVCSLHRGLVEGFVERLGGAEVVEFRSVAHRDPCQVELASPVAGAAR